MNLKQIFSFCSAEYVLCCVLALIYFMISGFYPTVTGGIFTALFITGHFFLLALGLFILLALCRLIGGKTAYWGSLLIGFLVNTTLLLDIFVYTQYRFHISGAMLQLFFGPAGREIFVFPTSTYFVLAVALLVILAVTWGLVRLACKWQLSVKMMCCISLVAVLCFAGYNGMYAWGKFMLVPSVLTQVTYLPWANPMSMNRRLRKMGFEPKHEPYETPRAGTLQYPIAPLTCSADPKPNILVILIDAWRADSFTAQTMPYTYAAYKNAPDAFYFTNHLSGGNATEAGVFSLFYSMPYAYWDTITGAKMRPVLMAELDKQGYQFGIFASSRLNSPEFNQNVFADIENLRLSSKGEEKWQRDEDAQQDFLHFLDTRNPEQPFFGFLFYDSAHGQSLPPNYQGPFTPSAPDVMNYLLLTKNTDPTPYLNRYKNSVHYIDGLLHQIFTRLKEKGLDKNTVIILTGDHGQEVNDTRHNFWGHNSNFAKYQTRVPLLVWWPGMQGQQVDRRTAHYDIVPLLLRHALLCNNPVSDYSSGYDLLDTTPRPWTIISSYTNKAVQEGNKISVLNNYGGMVTYNEDFIPTDTPVSAKALNESLKEFSHFYK